MNETDHKINCLEAALRTITVNEDGQVTGLNGPDAILEAAKKYYEWVNGTDKGIN